MELALGAVAGLAPKLSDLLQDEYVRQKGLRPDIESLSRELVMMHAALVDVSKVPRQKLSDVNKAWARQVRELSYDTEDAIDAFILRAARRELAADDVNIFKKIGRRVVDIVKNLKGHHQITDKVKDIKNLSKELADLCAKYRLNSSDANPTAGTSFDPRLLNMYKNEAELVGIEESKADVIRKLTDGDAGQSLKIVSIVGFGGLGKTTLAKIVHDSLKTQFDYSAFVSVGRNRHINSVWADILTKLDKEYSCVNMEKWNDERFSDELHKLLKDKRFFIVIDDIWDKDSWKRILYSLDLKDSNCGSRIIMTTRNADVVTKDEDIYRLKPLSHHNSKLLLSKRIGERECLVKQSDELADKILEKCGGIPLAIIAIASLLANKPWQKWSEVYDSMVSGHDEDRTMEIISYSYDDLPSYLKPCLLHFSAFPEDHVVRKNGLIWMWIGEGFVKIEKEGDNIFEQGERYFYELLNRSMILPVEEDDCSIEECSVHDIVFDLICNLSRQENFVTVSVREQYTSPKSVRRKKDMDFPSSDHMKVRRASLQNCHFKHTPSDILGTPDAIRSLFIMNTEVDAIPQLQVCRVLCIAHSNIPNLKHLGKLLHLRYLRINNTHVDRLPEEIADLKSLQTLILVKIGLEELPPAICKLTQLMCLNIAGFKRLPANKMGNLVSLEELLLDAPVSRSELDDLLVQLGKLTRLRVLHIDFSTRLGASLAEGSSQNALVNSLCSLEKVQDLKLITFGGWIRASAAWEGWEPPRQLWRLSIPDIIFHRLPAWINPLRLPRLSSLAVSALVVELQDLENLVRLPELCYLQLLYCWQIHQGYTVDATGGFKKLRTCKVPTAFKFQPGAMPSIEALDLRVILAGRTFTNGGVEYNLVPTKDAISDLDFGLENLLSLEKVNVEVDCKGARTSEVEDMVSVLERAVRDHPKHPTLSIKRQYESDMLDQVIHVSVRKIKEHLKSDYWEYHVADLGRLDLNERLEEVTFHIDCEGARLSEVEEVETALRQHVADVHPEGPNVHLVRESVDKMVSESDHCSTEGCHDDSASKTTEQSPTVAEEQDMSCDTKDKLASLALDR